MLVDKNEEARDMDVYKICPYLWKLKIKIKMRK